MISCDDDGYGFTSPYNPTDNSIHSNSFPAAANVPVVSGSAQPIENLFTRRSQQRRDVYLSPDTVPSIISGTTVDEDFDHQDCSYRWRGQEQGPFEVDLISADSGSSIVPSTVVTQSVENFNTQGQASHHGHHHHQEKNCHHPQRQCECEFCNPAAAISSTDDIQPTPITPPRLTPQQLAAPPAVASSTRQELQQPPALPFQPQPQPQHQHQPQSVMSFGGGGGYSAPTASSWATTVAMTQHEQLQMHHEAAAAAEAEAHAEASRQYEYAYRSAAAGEVALAAAATAGGVAVDEQDEEDTPLVRSLRERIRTLEAELDLALREGEAEFGGGRKRGHHHRAAVEGSCCPLCGASRVEDDEHDDGKQQRGGKRQRRQGRRVSNERDHQGDDRDVDDEDGGDFVSAPLIPPMSAAATTVAVAAGGTKGRGGAAQQRRPKPRLPTSGGPANARADGDRPKIIVDGRKHRHDATFEANCNLLREFKAKYGHCDASRKVKEHGKVGQFVFKQREHYKKYLLGKQSPLDPYRIGILEGIGLKWNHDKNAVWSRRYDELKKFKERYGHCCVPAVVNARWRQRPPLRGDDENDCPGGKDGGDHNSEQHDLERLAKWAEYQRKELQWMSEWERENCRSMTEDDRKVKNRGKGGKIRLTEERIDLLRSLGCNWLNSNDKEDDDEEYEYLERQEPSPLPPPRPEMEGDGDENEKRHEEENTVTMPVGDGADDGNDEDSSEVETALGGQKVMTGIGASTLTMSSTGGRRKSPWTWYRRFEVLRECNDGRTRDSRGGDLVVPAGLNWWVDAQRRLHKGIRDGIIECDSVFEVRLGLLADIGCVSNDDDTA